MRGMRAVKRDEWQKARTRDRLLSSPDSPFFLLTYFLKVSDDIREALL